MHIETINNGKTNKKAKVVNCVLIETFDNIGITTRLRITIYFIAKMIKRLSSLF